MIKYIIRLDDACPNMNIKKWEKTEQILDKYNIKPIVGIIPNNKDTEFDYKTIDDFFEKYPKKWQNKGWIIAQHGCYHLYHTCNNKKTEFMGLSLINQKELLKKGYELLKKHDITPKCFFAPNHTYDNNTIKACKDLGYYSFISDGYSLYPYSLNGMFHIPSIFDTPHRILPFGIYTFIYHPNNMTKFDFKHLEDFIIKYKKFFDINYLAIEKKYHERRKNPFDYVIFLVISIIRNIRNFFVKKVR